MINNITRKDLQEFLHDGIIEIMFEKKDGTKRKMFCTLNSEFIPIDMLPKNISDKPPIKENLDVMKVFDTENQGWRSFIIDNIKYVKTSLYESV
jgi:hypothetical protein